MPNNSQLPEPLTIQEVKRLLLELSEFKKSHLYKHFTDHFQALYDGTVEQVLEERLKGLETLFTREGWIGEARTAKLQITWFDELETALNEIMREKEKE